MVQGRVFRSDHFGALVFYFLSSVICIYNRDPKGFLVFISTVTELYIIFHSFDFSSLL